MVRFLVCTLTALGFSLPASAALDIGDRAPSFTAQAALGGTVYNFSLAESLKKGPVVLYFFPAAYSEDCSIEAHYFAEATEQFKALGTTYLRKPHRPLPKLSSMSTVIRRFSLRSPCGPTDTI